VALATADLFATIVAAFLAALLGLDRLAIDGRHPRLIGSARLFADLHAQGGDDLIPRAAVDPSPVVVVTGPPRREFVGDHPPLAAGTDQVQQSV